MTASERVQEQRSQPAGTPEAAQPAPLGGFADFAAAWDDLSRVVRQARGRARPAPGAGLTVSQFHLVDALVTDGKLKISEMAEAAGITSPTASRMIVTLERQGIVRRQRAEGDARVVEIQLTPEGRRAVAATRERLRTAQHTVYENLSAAERRQASVLLSRLADAIDQL